MSIAGYIPQDILVRAGQADRRGIANGRSEVRKKNRLCLASLIALDEEAAAAAGAEAVELVVVEERDQW